MINKKNLWFLTLFSLILVLSVYYITMPSELLISNNNNYIESKTDDPVVSVEESELLVALRVEADEQMMKEIDEYETIITSKESTIEQKNNAFESIKSLNVKRSEEESIEKQILETYKLKSFVRIDNDQIRIVIKGDEHNTDLANNIMRLVQSNYKDKVYISVKFQK